VRLQLRGNDTVRDAIFQRLGALSSADTLIEAADGKGAILRDVIEAELGPYQTSNVSVTGPTILLPPKLALFLALLFHELTTNAVKYGALSVPSGRVLISWSWSLAEERLSLECTQLLFLC
jgi:two-component sensor histidine kinase